KPLWKELKRIIKKNGSIILFSSQPFTTILISSNIKRFKYCWVWVKNRPALIHHSKNRPVSLHEDICVFSYSPMGHISRLGNRRMIYNPQGCELGSIKKVKYNHDRLTGPRKKQIGKIYQPIKNVPTT